MTNKSEQQRKKLKRIERQRKERTTRRSVKRQRRESWNDNVSPISSFFVGQVAEISCGHHHTLILSKSGVVHACGLKEYGALGVGGTDGVVDAPVEVKIGDGETVKTVAAGTHLSFAVTEKGKKEKIKMKTKKKKKGAVTERFLKNNNNNNNNSLLNY